jgi:orotidine-5'-phosphate decarboxylase
MAEVVLALDLPSGAEAMRLLERIPSTSWVKVGSILMTREGAPLVRALVARGHRVFLDLKWHDIPNTVAGAVTAAREMGVSMATVHALGGSVMMEAASVAAGGEIALVGVTVLTSHDAVGYARAVGRSEVDIAGEVERQAMVAAEAGLQGIVCSPKEVSLLRGRLGPAPLIIVPGIRRRSDPPGDQTRVAGARETVASGATHLVIGRPLLQASDPAAVFEEFLEEAE